MRCAETEDPRYCGMDVTHMSTSPLSQPPRSPSPLCRPSATHPGDSNNGSYSGSYDTASLFPGSVSGGLANITLADQNGSNNEFAAPARKKRVVKHKLDENGQPVVKSKQQRKPRDSNAPPPRKRVKKNPDAESKIEPTPAIRPTNNPFADLTTSYNPAPSPNGTFFMLQPASHTQFGPTLAPPTHVYGQVGNMDDVNHLQQTQPVVIQPRQSSGQRYDPIRNSERYDPIRSASAENARLASTASLMPSRLAMSPSINSAKASPSVHNLIDLASNGTSIQLAHRAPSPPVRAPAVDSRDIKRELSAKPVTGDKPKPVEKTKPAEKPKPVDKKKSPPIEKVAKSAHSPKPFRRKATPPLPPLGNGLLSAADFGEVSKQKSSKEYEEPPNQCIVIDVPCTKSTGNYVNFLSEVEKKYGFDVAYPRIAEHRRRMAAMEAAGAALESGAATGDEMSVDLSEPDSDVEMRGVNEDESPTAASGADGASKKTRRKKGDDYDKNDDFIDDTEQAWQEQALASKDGYFVWFGPLVQESDKPTSARGDGTAKRGARGTRRGGGPGSRGGKVGATKAKTTDGCTTTAAKAGRGAGVRKPRTTKADREAKEKEEQEAPSAIAAKGQGNSELVGVVGSVNH